MVAFIEEVSGDHAVDSTLLLSAGTGKVSIISGVTGQVESLNKSWMVLIFRGEIFGGPTLSL